MGIAAPQRDMLAEFAEQDDDLLRIERRHGEKQTLKAPEWLRRLRGRNVAAPESFIPWTPT